MNNLSTELSLDAGFFINFSLPASFTLSQFSNVRLAFGLEEI
jgi:hypothetical protein